MTTTTRTHHQHAHAQATALLIRLRTALIFQSQVEAEIDRLLLLAWRIGLSDNTIAHELNITPDAAARKRRRHALRTNRTARTAA